MSQHSAELIGLMSGTSGDGLDIAYCRFEKNERWAFRLLHTQTIPFPEDLGKLLSTAHRLPASELVQLDVTFGAWMGREVKRFCEIHQCSPLAICSHGHTVFHNPAQGYSLQIGNGWALRRHAGFPVVSDFRMSDIQWGGQGAPLVPVGDRYLFGEVDFCLNLGGIANISMEQDGQRLAFDTCPFNLLLNPLAEQLGAPYDDRGIWASQGRIHEELLADLNGLPFYALSGAKSLAREDMESVFTPCLEKFSIAAKDKLATLTEHYALQLARIIQRYQSHARPSVMLTGGGAYHAFFRSRLDYHLGGSWKQVVVSNQVIEFKEALVFAFLGYLRILGENNTLHEVTGASRDTCGGIYFG